MNGVSNSILIPAGEARAFVVKPPTVKKDDYIEFRAEMDCLAAISACPQDIAPVNNFRIKPLRVEVY